MSVRRDMMASSESVDPAVLAEAEAESRMVRLPSVQRRLSLVGQVLAAVVLTAGVVALSIGAMYLKADRGLVWMVFPALIVVVGGVGWLHAMMTHRRRTRRFRTALIKRGVPVCIHCGYSLRGRDSSRASCPECGALIQQSEAAP